MKQNEQDVGLGATIEVTLVTAIWSEPKVFAGVFEVRSRGPSRCVRFGFRAEASRGNYRFTLLRRQGAPEQVFEGPRGTLALEALTFALDGAVTLLEARSLTRFSEGHSVSSEPCGLDDLGFQVRFPYSPANDEAEAALWVLLGSSEGDPP